MGTLLDTAGLRAVAGIPPEVSQVMNGSSPIKQLM
jgi:hypothetical protein